MIQVCTCVPLGTPESCAERVLHSSSVQLVVFQGEFLMQVRRKSSEMHIVNPCSVAGLDYDDGRLVQCGILLLLWEGAEDDPE